MCSMCSVDNWERRLMPAARHRQQAQQQHRAGQQTLHLRGATGVSVQHTGLTCKHGRHNVRAIPVSVLPAIHTQLAQIGATVGRSYALRRQPRSRPAD
jgi:hypothetical protein